MPANLFRRKRGGQASFLRPSAVSPFCAPAGLWRRQSSAGADSAAAPTAQAAPLAATHRRRNRLPRLLRARYNLFGGHTKFQDSFRLLRALAPCGYAATESKKEAKKESWNLLLVYEIVSGEGISYRDPDPLTFSNHLANFDVAENRLRITPAEHFANEEEAREAIEPFLRAWEIDTDLKSNIGMIRFKFARVDVVDRDPPPPGSSQVIHVKGASYMVFGGSASLHLTCSKYPEPPAAFRATPEVQHAYRRWLGFRSGKEPLQAMSYYVLTVAESAAGGRQAAARKFQIQEDVLGTIGRLSSTKGDETTARKAGAGNQYEDLSAGEKRWLEEAVRLLIRRLGEHASGAPLNLRGGNGDKSN
jgi:hypothetical protein